MGCIDDVCDGMVIDDFYLFWGEESWSHGQWEVSENRWLGQRAVRAGPWGRKGRWECRQRNSREKGEGREFEWEDGGDVYAQHEHPSQSPRATMESHDLVSYLIPVPDDIGIF